MKKLLLVLLAALLVFTFVSCKEESDNFDDSTAGFVDDSSNDASPAASSKSYSSGHSGVVDFVKEEGEYEDGEYSIYEFYTDDENDTFWVNLSYDIYDEELKLGFSDADSNMFILTFTGVSSTYDFVEGDSNDGERLIYGTVKSNTSLSENSNSAVEIEYYAIDDETFYLQSKDLIEVSEKWIGTELAMAVLLADNLLLDDAGLSLQDIYNVVI